jgi:hypothetical protein
MSSLPLMLLVTLVVRIFIPILLTYTLTPFVLVKRRLAKDKPLRVDEILNQRSAVPAVKSKNAFKKPEMTDRVHSKYENKTLKRKIENNAPVAPKKKNKKATNTKSYDLWDEGKRLIFLVDM